MAAQTAHDSRHMCVNLRGPLKGEIRLWHAPRADPPADNAVDPSSPSHAVDAHSCSAVAREASSACAPDLGRTRRTAEGSLVGDGPDVLVGLRGAFLQLANDMGEHLRHLVVRAELDHPDRFLDDDGVT